MAVFKPHYILCPLIGANNLVGIVSDKEDGSVLVTLGPNIVVKHKLTDQKPIKSWSTRQTNKLTCSTIYDTHQQKYVGILNRKHLIMWEEDEPQIEDVKKYMFTSTIFKVHPLEGKPSIVVFNNGFCENLNSAIEKRKEDKPALLAKDEVISKCYLESVKDRLFMVLISDKHKVYFVRLNNSGMPEGNLHFSLRKSNKLKVLGVTTVNDGQDIFILALWSNGELIQYSEQGGELATHHVKGLSLTSSIAMRALDSTRIAMYGADASEEGALLLLFDLKVGMSVSSRRLKFFCDPPVLYYSTSNQVVLVCVGQNLVVVPYVLQPSLLWNLIDKNPAADKTQGLRSKPQVVHLAKSRRSTIAKKNPLMFNDKELNQLAESLWTSEVSYSQIFNELIPPLQNKRDFQGLCHLLKTVGDLPERWHAELLNFFLENTSENITEEESKMLQIILSISYSDVLLLDHLRMKLTTKSTIKLLKYLCHLFENCRWAAERTCRNPDIEMETDDSQDAVDHPDIRQIVDWICLILDAHHHELLIAGNEQEIQDLIQHLQQHVIERHEFLDYLGEIEPLIEMLSQNKKPPENRRNDWYCIEVVRLL